nr:hypothetical protein [Tanacetum cinerariifolium]
MSVEEIERVVAQRVANAIEAIAIYETKTNLARRSMSQIERQKEKVVENASNKRKWEGNHNGSSSQQNKGHKVPRAHTAWKINKKAYAGSLPLYNQCKFHHNGPYTVKCENYKKRLDNTYKKNQNQQPPNKRQNTGRVYTTRHGEKKHYGGFKPLFSKCYYHHDGPCAPKCHQCNRFGHLARDCRSSINANTSNIQKGTGASQKATCYECGNQGHYRKIFECQTENKKRLDNTSKNNLNQQQPNKRQNTGRAYIARHGEKKHYNGSKPLCPKCYYHHDGPCAPKCHPCNRFGHLALDCRSSTNANTTNIQKGTEASQKATCYECGNQGHYRRDCLEKKKQNHENQIKSTKACGVH